VMSAKNRFVVQGSSELPNSEGYEKVPTDEPSDRLISYEADDTEILSDRVSRHQLYKGCKWVLQCMLYCVMCPVFLLTDNYIFNRYC